MDDCEFCRIVTGKRDAHELVTADSAVAFLDENPANPGHTLVVPTSHCEFLFREEESVVVDVFRTVRRVVGALNRVLEPAGVSVFHTSGPLTGTVSHAHVHVVPRYEDDDIHLALDRDDASDAELAALAERIRYGF